MKILAPLHSIDLLDELAAAGAKEFYIETSVETGKPKDIEEMAERAHRKQAEFYAKLNMREYCEIELNLLEEYLKILSKCKVDGVAVNVPELVPLIRGFGMKAIAGVEFGIPNVGLAQWYKKIGINRIVLPETMECEDVSFVMEKVPDIEYEIILMRDGSGNSDEGGALPTCRQCALYRLLQTGISSVKMVGYQGNDCEVICDVKLTYRNLQIAHGCSNEAEYLEKMILPEDQKLYCGDKFSCHYPAVC